MHVTDHLVLTLQFMPSELMPGGWVDAMVPTWMYQCGLVLGASTSARQHCCAL